MALVDDIKKAKEIVDGLPEDQKEHLTKLLSDLDSDGDGVPDVVGIKRLFWKDGEFSKTALFAVIGNTLVLGTYAFQSWFAGTAIDISTVHRVVPAFDSTSAAYILALLNGTYVTSHAVGSAKQKAEAAATTG